MSYLDRSSYVAPADMLVPRAFRGNVRSEHTKRLNGLMRVFADKLSPTTYSRPFVRHYLERYGFVPLWVLQNDMTFGNTAHFYQLCERGVQNDACRIIGRSAGNGRWIAPRELLRAFAVLVGYRNICAHDERLYCANVRGAAIDGAVAQLELVLPEQETGELDAEINALLAKYDHRIDCERIGFDWRPTRS